MKEETEEEEGRKDGTEERGSYEGRGERGTEGRGGMWEMGGWVR